MLKDFALFPTLSEDLKQKIRIQESPYSFFYIDGEIKHALECKDFGSSNKFSLFEENGPWNVDEYNFGFSKSYKIRFQNCLFGRDGIVCQNAELGIAIVWTSADSKQRGVIPANGSVKFSNDTTEINVEHLFDKAQLRGCVGLQTVLYIKKPGTPFDDENHLANSYGFILGELSNDILFLDGNGSEFPVQINNEPGQPLWRVKCDWDDPKTDLFSESVSIILNEGHPNFTFIDKKSPNYNQAMVVEIFSQALLIIITKLKQDESYWNDTINENNLSPGSVSEAVAYFVNTLNWDSQSAENTSLSIRKFFEGKSL